MGQSKPSLLESTGQFPSEPDSVGKNYIYFLFFFKNTEGSEPDLEQRRMPRICKYNRSKKFVQNKKKIIRRFFLLLLVEHNDNKLGGSLLFYLGKKKWKKQVERSSFVFSGHRTGFSRTMSKLGLGGMAYCAAPGTNRTIALVVKEGFYLSCLLWIKERILSNLRYPP